MGRGTPGVCRKRRVVGEGQNQLCGMGVESQAEKAMGLAGVRAGGRRGLEGQPGGADSSWPHWSWGRA